MKKKLIILVGIMTIMLIVVVVTIMNLSRNSEEVSDTKNDNIRVVTSFYPTYVLTLNLTDNISNLEVESLTDFSAGCLHDYQLTTNDMKLLSNADIFIINGGGMEEYLEDIIDNYPQLKVIDLSEGIEILKSEVHEGEGNPHVWLDPELYMLQIENARLGLEQYIEVKLNNEDSNNNLYDNYNKEVIAQLNTNARVYLENIRELSDDMNLMLETVNDMVHNKNISNKVVVFHDSFAYLSNKAGLEVAYTVEVDEDTPLSAGEVAEVISAIRQDNIQYLFTEEQYDDTISNRIKDETGAKIYVIDSAVTGDATKDSYLKAMKKNIETLRLAFEEFIS